MKKLVDPPNILTLYKKGVQSFTGDQKVALYYCEAVKKYFSFTYNKNGMELMESDYSFIHMLSNISDVSEIYFNNNKKLNINSECSGHIINLYNKLSEGQEEFIEYIQESDENFLKILTYAINRNE